MKKKEREEWLFQKLEEFQMNKLEMFGMGYILHVETILAFIEGIYFATILCTTSAWNAFLIQKLYQVPEGKTMLSSKELIKKAEFITEDLKLKLIKFQRSVRDQIIHPKSLDPAQNLIGTHNPLKNMNQTSFQIENNNLKDYYELFRKHPIAFADEWGLKTSKEGLLLYFQLIKSYYDSNNDSK